MKFFKTFFKTNQIIRLPIKPYVKSYDESDIRIGDIDFDLNILDKYFDFENLSDKDLCFNINDENYDNIQNLNLILIKKKKLNLLIDTAINEPLIVTKTINSYFTTYEILHFICESYKNIYAIENQTTTKQIKGSYEDKIAKKILSRSPTNGKYKLHTYFLEELHICAIDYDPKKNTLYPRIKS